MPGPFRVPRGFPSGNSAGEELKLTVAFNMTVRGRGSPRGLRLAPPRGPERRPTLATCSRSIALGTS
jgi:hypothetical protein